MEGPESVHQPCIRLQPTLTTDMPDMYYFFFFLHASDAEFNNIDRGLRYY